MVKTVASEKIRHADGDLAEMIAVGAVKFAILFTGRLTDTAFDIDRATNLEGDSGPYLQYTHARISSMLEKAFDQSLVPKYQEGIEPVYYVERLAYRFPEIVKSSLDEYAPNHIATYLIELARAFNAFYAEQVIIDAEHPEISAHRLALAKSVQTILSNGLALLGIKAPHKM